MSGASPYYFDHECYDNPEHLKVLDDKDVGKCNASSSVVYNLDTKQVQRSQELDLSASTEKFRVYIYSSPSMVDLNVDGNMDTLVGTSLGLFYVLVHHGNTRKNFSLKMAGKDDEEYQTMTSRGNNQIVLFLYKNNFFMIS
uniref:Uncharacterized protein n=1 Tax=Salix viminalis TaxID=40686 RepID=A0A6N2KX58_SALVM